jgi:predicted extracellular nuclease
VSVRPSTIQGNLNMPLRPVLACALVLAAALGAAAPAQASPSGVVISEFRFRGAAGASDEFVELLNTSPQAVAIGGWRLQGCAADSGAPTLRATVPAGTTLEPGQHFLFTNSAGPVDGDAEYATGIADEGGARLTRADGTTVEDGVGSSSGAVDQCREGAGIAGIPGTNTDNSYARLDGGRQDTDVNADDFTGPQAGTPARLTSPPAPVEATVAQIQGPGHVSPLRDRPVTGVEGIVTARRTAGGRGVWVQAPDDGDLATSTAVFVFTGATPTAPVGAAVSVAGTATEFRAGCSAFVCVPTESGYDNLSITQITSSNAQVTVVSTGNALPAPIVLGPAGRTPPTENIDDDATGNVETSGVFDPVTDAIDFYESLEGARLQVDAAVVVGPTKSFGELVLLPDAGIWATGLRTSRGGILYSYADPNPERITVDDEILRDLTPGTRPPKAMPDADVGDLVTSSIVGPLDYTFANYKIQATSTPVMASGGLEREATAVPRDQELAVATFNVENLDPSDGASFDRLAGLVVDNLRSPDLIGIEEVQDDTGETDDGTVTAAQGWQLLVDAIVAAGGPLYEYRQIDPLDNEDGGAPGGNIRVGFLFRTDRGLSFVDRPGGDATTATAVVATPAGPRLSLSPGRIAPADPAFVDTRKSLAGEFRFRGKKLFAIVNHFSSKGGDDPLFGRWQPPVRYSEVARHGQAQAVNDLVDSIVALDPQAYVVVLGDINDFEFSETVDLLEGGVLTTLVDTLPANERYSYVFEGNSQTLDQILASDRLLGRLTAYDVVHVNAEFADQASDHDPSLARFSMIGPT